jgi:hypothetical protein
MMALNKALSTEVSCHIQAFDLAFGKLSVVAAVAAK